MNRHLVLRLALLLEAALPALDKAASNEKRREAGKRMRSITEQQRAETARALVEEAFDALNADEPEDEEQEEAF